MIDSDACIQEEMDEIDSVRNISKLKFKRNPNMHKSGSQFKKNQQNGSYVDRSKFKCNKYGMAGHLRIKSIST